VLDCFSGSGSTNVAALKCNRHSIGIEIEQKWVDYSIGKVRKAMSELGDTNADTQAVRNDISSDLPLFKS
jgi:DNA modification methylase